MPEASIPTITDDTPGGLTVYIQNPADGSIGTCTVEQYRDLYKGKGWALSTPDAYAAHDQALADEHRSMQVNDPSVLYPPTGKTAAEQATTRTAPTPKTEV